jgi:hypothetical protein
MYNSDLVRKLCADILNEKDPETVRDLISLLQAVIKEDQEEVRIRLTFLTKKYAKALTDSQAGG